MKIYTFNAPDDTRVEILSSLRPKNKDRIFQNFIDETDYTEVNSIQECDVAIYPNRVFNPETLVFDNLVFGAAEKANKYNKLLILDATSDSDKFLNIPTANILRCGLYRSLKKPFEIECPFWSNYRTKIGLDSLEILPKSKKPRVGFCGTTASIGKLSNIIKKISPASVTRLILSRGILAQKTDPRVVEGMSLQLREMALEFVSRDRRIDSDFNITNNNQTYYAKDDSNKILLEKSFIDNTSKCDYVVCVRGSGNYSGRFYMALNAGRIPVVVDTDLVIPFEEHLNIVKVPVKSVKNIGDFIWEHFSNTTNEEFKKMKLQNRRVYNQLLAPEKFFVDFLNNTVVKKYQAESKVPKQYIFT